MDELLADSRIYSKLKPKNESFEAAFKSVMQSNGTDDLIEGFKTLTEVIEPLLKLEVVSDAFGVERSL